MSKSIQHILVIRLSAMGDVAMTVPVLKAVIQQNPQLRITVLTRGFFAPFFKDVPNVEVFEADVKGAHKGIWGLFKLSRSLKQLKIDAVADLHNVLRSNVLKRFLMGIPFVQINKGRQEKKALVKGEKFEPLKSTHQRYADVFKALGFPVDISGPIAVSNRPLSQELQNIITEPLNGYIGIAPFAAFQSKAYPIELMSEVIESLSKDHKILLFGGGAKEIEVLQALANRFPNTVNLAGKLRLDEELDVISHLEVMIAMDSGNAHIAAMLGKQVITLWGVTHPYAGFYPFGQDLSNALLADRNQYPRIPTSIYGNKFPENYEHAIASITPDAIVQKVRVLHKKRPH